MAAMCPLSKVQDLSSAPALKRSVAPVLLNTEFVLRVGTYRIKGAKKMRCYSIWTPNCACIARERLEDKACIKFPGKNNSIKLELGCKHLVIA